MYVTSSPSERLEHKRIDKERESSSFGFVEQPEVSKKIVNLPVDYISRNIGFWQKNEFQKELQEKNTQNNPTLFKAISDTLQAKESYTQNSKIFSNYPKVLHQAIDQTPKIDINFADGVQEMQEKNMRNVMVNTYLSNDRYYQVTA
jgi:hypothetical protein